MVFDWTPIVWKISVFLGCPFSVLLARESSLLLGLALSVSLSIFRLLVSSKKVWVIWGTKKTQGPHHSVVPWVPRSPGHLAYVPHFSGSPHVLCTMSSVFSGAQVGGREKSISLHLPTSLLVIFNRLSVGFLRSLSLFERAMMVKCKGCLAGVRRPGAFQTLRNLNLLTSKCKDHFLRSFLRLSSLR